MRLLYLNADPGVPLFGRKGASVHVRSLVRALAARGSRVTIVTARRSPRSSAPCEDPLPADVIEFAPTHEAAPMPPDGVSESLALNDRIEEVVGMLLAREGFDAIYERHSLGIIAGAQIARRYGIPRVVEMNAPLVDEATRHRNLRLRSLTEFLEQRNISEADRVVVVSEELARHVRSWGVPDDHIAVIPNGYDASRFPPPETRERGLENAAAPLPFTIVFVGRARPWHGLELLVDAFERVYAARPHARLLVLGDGPSAESARRRLETVVAASSFEMTGEVDHALVPALLRGADVAIAPYPRIEPFYFSPLKVFEYAAAGLPIVASAIGQIREIFVDEESALLVPAGDADAIARAVIRLVDDSDLRRKLGRGARAAMRGRTWDDVAAKVTALLASVQPAPSAAGAGR